ncbi:MAG: hypothetical protein J5J00_07535 [Deltaproteobacteria bacterium]|nr:hypothetical protein [Deltaproteobacteria bacterium]
MKPIEDLARDNASRLPGPAEAFSLFEKSLRVLDDPSQPAQERRINFIRAISAIELIEDPSISAHKSLQVIDSLDSRLHAKLTGAGDLFTSGSDAAGEMHLWAVAVNESYELLKSVLHSRSALAAGAAEVARRNGFVAQAVIFDPSTEDPVALRLIKSNSAFIATFYSDRLSINEMQELRPEVLPIEVRDWLAKIISEHKGRFDEPDKQAALLRLELMLVPSDYKLQRELIVSLREAGRPDAAIEVANRYMIHHYKGLD